MIFNNPADLPWQTVLYDLLAHGIFVAALIYAVVQYRRGIRVYAFVFVTAFIYGIVLELAGMALLNMYVQGDFTVMLNAPEIPLFAGTTLVPSYVSLFYPGIFTIGFKIVEGLGIAKRWQAAVTAGLFMICMDAPYIIEGNLRHVVWWTWDTNFPMFQLWLGWPLADMAWQSVWGALFIYLVLRARPALDGPAIDDRWSNAYAFGVRAPLTAIFVILVGTVLLSPLTIFTFAVGPQWPVMVLWVAFMVVVAAAALHRARPRRTLDGFAAALVVCYVTVFGIMVTANVIRDGSLHMYSAVQVLGLLAMIGYVSFPLWAPSHRRAVTAMRTVLGEPTVQSPRRRLARPARRSV